MHKEEEYCEPGKRIKMKLLLRRTLIQHCIILL